jgi:hypothetical protein
MPKYVYKCNLCEEHFEVHHGMSEDYHECIYCPSLDVTRVSQMPFVKTSVQPKGDKVGNKTKEAIEANREILKRMKKEASRDYFRDDN